jgi:hypothetical protein
LARLPATGFEMTDEDLQQADFSHLRLSEMTTEQKAEMRRRYVDFVRRLAKPAPASRTRSSKTAKWLPGKKVG